jgi:hypothetical protein
MACVEFKCQSEVGGFGGGFGDLGKQRQINRGDQVMPLVVFVNFISQHNALCPLNEQGEK